MAYAISSRLLYLSMPYAIGSRLLYLSMPYAIGSRLLYLSMPYAIDKWRHLTCAAIVSVLSGWTLFSSFTAATWPGP
jgi:hypothetical protein